MRYNHFDMLPEMAFRSLGGRMTLEGGGKGSAPAAPDYTAAAQQTAAGNKETAIATQAGNMINQYTPQGSVTYAQRGEYAGTPLWEQVVKLSPEQQAAYNKDVAMNARLQDVGMQGVGYVQQALNAPLASPGQAVGTAGTTNFVTGVNAPSLSTQGGNLGGMQRGVGEPTIGLATGANAGPMQMGVNTYSDVARGIAPSGQINQGVYQNAGQIRTNVQDPTLVQQQVTDALYQQQANILDPQFTRSQARLENQLANQGITRGSEAWNTAMQEANLQKQQAYESARQSAIGQGVSAASGLYQNQLAGMGAANQALGQQFGQGVTAQQAQNAAQAQQFGQNQAQQQAYNQALAQQFGQGLQGAQFANTAQSQAYQQQLSNAQMQNQARAQQLQEALSRGEFTNQAQAQAYQQELQNIQNQNAVLAQQFSFGQQNAALANQAANQQYAQQLSNAQLANQALQQNFGNAQTLQQQPINILNAVRSGAQMQASAQPQVGVSAPGQLANFSGPDYLSAATATGQYNQGLYNAQQAASGNQMSGLMGLTGMLGAAGINKYSDERTKENVIKIGKLDNGLNLYQYEYKPEWKIKAGFGKFIGVMAGEVEKLIPQAVKLDADGYKMVDYGVIYG